jgi:hypothetical protein
MPQGTITVDQAATFAAALLMSSARKTKYGTQGEVATNAAGVPQWTCEVAVSYRVRSGERAISECLTVTITNAADPFAGITPGMPVQFDGLRAGLSPPESGDNGRIRGGRLWYQADGITAAVPAGSRNGRGEG